MALKPALEVCLKHPSNIGRSRERRSSLVKSPNIIAACLRTGGIRNLGRRGGLVIIIGVCAWSDDELSGSGPHPLTVQSGGKKGRERDGKERQVMSNTYVQ